MAVALDAGSRSGKLKAFPIRPTISWLATTGVAVVLAVVVAALPLEVAAGAGVGGIVVVLAFFEPLVALTALIAVLPFSSLLAVDTGDFSVTILEPLVALLLIAWLVRGLPHRDIPLSGRPLLVPLALLLLAILFSSVAAERPTLALKETMKWLELAVVFTFTTARLRGQHHQRAILAVLFLAGSGEALYGVFQYATGQGPAAFAIGETLRAYGHFEQPNPFAGYLATILPLGLAMAWLGRPRRYALLAGLAIVLITTGIALSLSRGAWVGAVLAIGAMLWVWSADSRKLLPWIGGSLLLVLLAAGTGLLPGNWADRVSGLAGSFGVFDAGSAEVTPENFAVVERMAHWQAGWQMFVEHPLVGVGVGNYPAAYDNYSLPAWPEALGHAHNYYLNMAAETGLLGVAALLLLIGSIYRALLSGLRRHQPGTYERALLVGLIGSFVVFTVHNLFDNLLVHGMQVQIGLLMGLVVRSSESADHRDVERTPRFDQT